MSVNIKNQREKKKSFDYSLEELESNLSIHIKNAKATYKLKKPIY